MRRVYNRSRARQKLTGPRPGKVVAERHKDPHSNKCNNCYYSLDPETNKTRMSERSEVQGHPTKNPSSTGCYEDVRVVKETGLRSVGASLVGSTPTPRKEFG